MGLPDFVANGKMNGCITTGFSALHSGVVGYD